MTQETGTSLFFHFNFIFTVDCITDILFLPSHLPPVSAFISFSAPILILKIFIYIV